VTKSAFVLRGNLIIDALQCCTRSETGCVMGKSGSPLFTGTLRTDLELDFETSVSNRLPGTFTDALQLMLDLWPRTPQRHQADRSLLDPFGTAKKTLLDFA